MANISLRNALIGAGIGVSLVTGGYLVYNLPYAGTRAGINRGNDLRLLGSKYTRLIRTTISKSEGYGFISRLAGPGDDWSNIDYLQRVTPELVGLFTYGEDKCLLMEGVQRKTLRDIVPGDYRSDEEFDSCMYQRLFGLVKEAIKKLDERKNVKDKDKKLETLNSLLEKLTNRDFPTN